MKEKLEPIEITMPFDEPELLDWAIDNLNYMFQLNPTGLKGLLVDNRVETGDWHSLDIVESMGTVSGLSLINYLFAQGSNNRIARIVEDETGEIKGFCRFTGKVG